MKSSMLRVEWPMVYIFRFNIVSLPHKFMNILFVCTMNRWRSLTAEELFKNNGQHNVLSAGTSEKARVRLSHKHIEWAELIFVMEKKHKQIVRQRFSTDKQIIVLDIPDDYTYMDTELIEMLQISVSPYL